MISLKNVVSVGLTLIVLGFWYTQQGANKVDHTAPVTAGLSANSGKLEKFSEQQIERIQFGAFEAGRQSTLSALNSVQASLQLERNKVSTLSNQLSTLTAELEKSKDSSTETCVSTIQKQSPQFTVYFDAGQSNFKKEDIRKIRQFSNMLATCPDAVVHVAGHSDASGDELANLVLSWQRADAVVSTMEALGVDVTYVDSLGFGTRKPKSQGDAGDNIDRRVEFHVLPNIH